MNVDFALGWIGIWAKAPKIAVYRRSSLVNSILPMINPAKTGKPKNFLSIHLKDEGRVANDSLIYIPAIYARPIVPGPA
jgi:hypothetical protein